MMEQPGEPGAASRMRADARRNLDRILSAARDAFVEQGPDAPLDGIARRAGVGIATLYRRFPERQALARAVALDLWARVVEETQRALAEEPDAFRALSRYMHRALDLRIGAVMPLVASDGPTDDELRLAAARSAESVQGLVAAAQAEGTLRPDVSSGDTGLLLIRLSRPLPGPFPRALDEALAHRHLGLLLDGLRAESAGAAGPLPGPAVTLENLRTMFPEAGASGSTRPEPGPP
jgi:AcrR family transcriptional regulator